MTLPIILFILIVMIIIIIISIFEKFRSKYYKIVKIRKGCYKNKILKAFSVLTGTIIVVLLFIYFTEIQPDKVMFVGVTALFIIVAILSNLSIRLSYKNGKVYDGINTYFSLKNINKIQTKKDGDCYKIIFNSSVPIKNIMDFIPISKNEKVIEVSNKDILDDILKHIKKISYKLKLNIMIQHSEFDS